MTSFPSTCSPANPAAIAFWASVVAADWAERGSEMAHWLLVTTNTAGSRQAPATFSAS